MTLLADDIHKKMELDCSSPSKILVYSPTKNNLKDTINSYITNLRNNETRSTDFVNDEAYGFYRRFNHRKENEVSFIITISNKLNDCWARFVETKELAHVIIDKSEENYVKDLQGLIASLVENPPMIRFDDDIPSEYITLFFAIELLLPYCMNDDIINHDRSSFDAAKLFMVPEKTVDLIRTEWYQDMRKKAYQE